MPRPVKSYLKTHRLAAALTQPELGELLGVSFDAVSKYELGQRAVSARTLIAYQIIFGVDAAALLPGLFDEVEDALGRRALALHARLSGKTDETSLKKLALLDGIPSRIRSSET